MSGFHNEHIYKDPIYVEADGKCYTIAKCEICHEDISWLLNRR